ncbi:MAG: response regulator [Alphaproteobacteria bacterium]|nr:response regulator [Alphaproteobacteria bacterium]
MITILVIDADPAVRLAARRVLEAAGFTVISVPNASAALHRLETLRADLVICDISMPGPEGASAIDAIRGVDPLAHILGLFAKDRDSSGVLSGMTYTLGKPFTASELLTVVRRCLARPGLRPS